MILDWGFSLAKYYDTIFECGGKFVMGRGSLWPGLTTDSCGAPKLLVLWHRIVQYTPVTKVLAPQLNFVGQLASSQPPLMVEKCNHERQNLPISILHLEFRLRKTKKW